MKMSSAAVSPVSHPAPNYFFGELAAPDFSEHLSESRAQPGSSGFFRDFKISKYSSGESKAEGVVPFFVRNADLTLHESLIW